MCDTVEWEEVHMKLASIDNNIFNRLKNKYTNVKLVGKFPNNFIEIDNYKIGDRIRIEFY